MPSSARSSESSTTRQLAPNSSQRSRSARVSGASVIGSLAWSSGRDGLVGRGQPRVAVPVLAGVGGGGGDEEALDLPIADLEHVAPASGAPLRDAGAPGAVLMLAVAGALAHDGVRA